MSGTTWSDDPAWKEFADDFTQNGLPKVESSGATVSIISGNAKDFDPKQAIELGAMLLLDKPIILLQVPGATLPIRLARAADCVIDNWEPSDEGFQRLQDAIRAFVPDEGDEDGTES